MKYGVFNKVFENSDETSEAVCRYLDLLHQGAVPYVVTYKQSGGDASPCYIHIAADLDACIYRGGTYTSDYLRELGYKK
jgi:hypothetical protein